LNPFLLKFKTIVLYQKGVKIKLVSTHGDGSFGPNWPTNAEQLYLNKSYYA